MNIPENSDSSPRSPVARILRLLAALAANLFALLGLGIAAGGVVAMVREASISGKGVGVIALGVAVSTIGFLIFRKFNPFDFASHAPIGPKTRRWRRAFLIAALLGVVIGVLLSLSAGQAGLGALGNGPLPPAAALAVVVLYIVFTPFTTYLAHRNADEFERAASGRGALVGIYAYALIAPSWWILERGGLAPPQEPMIVFAIVLTIWGLAWLLARGE